MQKRNVISFILLVTVIGSLFFVYPKTIYAGEDGEEIWITTDVDKDSYYMNMSVKNNFSPSSNYEDITYCWQKSENNGENWSDIANSNTESLNVYLPNEKPNTCYKVSANATVHSYSVIRDAYKSFLLRTEEVEGLQYWTAKLINNWSADHIKNRLDSVFDYKDEYRKLKEECLSDERQIFYVMFFVIFSDEFCSLVENGRMTIDDYIDRLYLFSANRYPTAEEKNQCFNIYNQYKHMYFGRSNGSTPIYRTMSVGILRVAWYVAKTNDNNDYLFRHYGYSSSSFNYLSSEDTWNVGFETSPLYVPVYRVNLSGNEYIDSLDGNGLYVPGNNVTVNAKCKMGDTKYNYKFIKWGGDREYNDAKVSFVMPFWDINLTAYGERTGRLYNAYFNANGGNCSTASKLLTYGKIYGDLPVATREDSTFLGWYIMPYFAHIENNDNKKINSGDLFLYEKDITLYAGWSDNKKPVINVATDNNEGIMTIENWRNNTINLIINIRDIGFSGLKYVSIYDDYNKNYILEKNFSLNNTSFEYKFALGDKISHLDEGEHLITVKARDYAENEETISFYVRLDFTPPAILCREEYENRTWKNISEILYSPDGYWVIIEDYIYDNGNVVANKSSKVLKAQCFIPEFGEYYIDDENTPVISYEPFIFSGNYKGDKKKFGIIIKAYDKAGNISYRRVIGKEYFMYKLKRTIPAENYAN